MKDRGEGRSVEMEKMKEQVGRKREKREGWKE